MVQNGTIRNWKFDYLKGISCIIVIFLHCPFYGILGELVIYAFRFSVPLFFMITGYYTYSKDDLWIREKAFSLLKLTVMTELFYFVWFVVDCCFIRQKRLIAELVSLAAFKHPVRTILFGYFFNETLWYLYAAFWTYLILLLFRKIHFSENSRLYRILPVILLCIHVLGRYYVQNNSYLDIKEYVYLFRSSLLFGLPLTMIGSIFAQQEDKIKNALSLAANFCIVIAGFFMIIAEYFASAQYMDFHFSTLVISIGLFLLAFTYEKSCCPGSNLLCYVGRDLSMWIYLIHYFVISIFNMIGVLCFSEENKVYLIIKPLLACAGVMLLAVFISRFRHQRREHGFAH